MCYRIVELSTHFKGGNSGHLKMINKAIKSMKENPIAVQYPKLGGGIRIIGFCDAVLNYMDDKVLSGRGYIVFLVDEEMK